MKKGRIFWVSGIDTGIGKTVVTGLLARSLLLQGKDVITVKMVQTGNVGHSEDIDLHRSICGQEPLPEDREGLTMPQIFAFPSSPLLAARLELKTVDLNKIATSVDECARRHDIVLVESAGGLAVPLTEDVLSVDFAAQQKWPLILVTSGRLGSINHAILSLEAAKSRGLQVVGVVHNYHPEVDPQIDEDSANTIRRQLVRLGFPPNVIRVPQVSQDQEYPTVDFSALV